MQRRTGWKVRLAARLTAAAFVAALAPLSAGAASGQTRAASGTSNPTQAAYDAALRCFVANGRAIGLQERAGNAEAASRYEQKARLSFDTAVRLGQSLGLSGSRINQDLGIAQGRELPQMVNDRRYFEQAVSTCRALGLM
ncbi:MAG: hypothetical protein JHC96_04550 [Brevundimonas sp.]|uniref:hypothetical protein n=1 Tax=Brevundimonas sp. TaxID=1871086 RepID=UPI001A330431|nr:hypothetical protein [Brevundimonas sp.]MBJ7318051.1 hypothetical protein [Brevundimonas sp.]